LSHEQRGPSAYDDPGTPEEITRRTFMANATLTLSGLIGLGLAIPIVGSLIPEVGAGTTTWSQLDDAGFKALQASTDTPVQINFVLSDKDSYLPEQQAPESVWGVKVPDLDKFKTLRPDIYANPGGNVPYPAINLGFAIFSPICPHLGCRFNYSSEAGKFLCPCHGSTYDNDGQHLSGPATRGLDPLPLREQSGKAQITWIRYAPTIPDRIVVSYTN
jgi:menaquinol-cytochrome c reductase iron-sulfur subunit